MDRASLVSGMALVLLVLGCESPTEPWLLYPGYDGYEQMCVYVPNADGYVRIPPVAWQRCRPVRIDMTFEP